MRKKKKQWQYPAIILFENTGVNSGKTCGTNEGNNIPPASVATKLPGGFLTIGGKCRYITSSGAWGRDAISTGSCAGIAVTCVS